MNAADIRFLESKIREIPDFPTPGIRFKDITPLLADGQALRTALDLMAEHVRPLQPTLIMGIESRGFVFGAPLADRLGVGFAPARKSGKLPFRRIREEYSLEYGTAALEIHEDAACGQRVLIVDDLLATGGTAAAAARLCERQGAEVLGCLFLIELGFLEGRKRLGNLPAHALLRY
ncbi:MAG: adenine phosphoribosyltransferase [Polyangia bacterium]